MKKILAVIAMLMLTTAVFAEFNPYSPEQTDLPIALTVEEIGEISWKNQDTVELTVKNFADLSDPEERILRVTCNVDVAIDCEIKTGYDLQKYTALFVSAQNQTKIFRRNDGDTYVESYLYTAPLITRNASGIGTTIASESNEVPVTFQARADHGVAAAATRDLVLAWTISPLTTTP